MTLPSPLIISRFMLIRLLLLIGILPGGFALADEEMTLRGPKGLLHGAYIHAEENLATVLIIPGSGPIDRDGNGGFGIRSNVYKLLAQGLAESGISSLRIDKRGMYSSSSAIEDGNKVTIEDYAGDVSRWSTILSSKSGHDCVWLLGHSEGGLVALKTVESGNTPVCGLLLAAVPGRPLGELMREQLKANPANAPLLKDAFRILDNLEAGRKVPDQEIPDALKPLFSSGLQDYMINLFSHDPLPLMASFGGPSLILQGTEDMQVTTSDAEKLHSAGAQTKLQIQVGMSHMLKQVEGTGMEANFATYTNPHLPLATGVVPALREFILINQQN
ncbi:alpha/beta fold hydrolase [Roseibium sp. SCPC15]|uniref:alpha/beta hydrolase n=1 Tax=Roseibium sp. SCP15 TaxID=3141376 RepID=UPI00333D70D7